MAREPPEFYLSNGADSPAIVHSLLEHSTDIWQYIVADPSTSHCIFIDPIRDACADRAKVSTSSADAIVNLVKKHGYLVDHILGTNASPTKHQTAAWYLRIQFSNLQGWPPQLYSNGTVSAMQSVWQRRYGSKVSFNTNLGQSLADGDCLKVGRTRVHCLQVLSFAAPDSCGFLVDGNQFGAHGIAIPPKNQPFDTSLSTPIDAETYTNAWTSMRRVLSLPEETVVHATGGSNKSENINKTSVTIREYRLANSYVDLSAPEFAIRWEGERQATLQQTKEQGSRSSRSYERGKRDSDIPLEANRK